MSRLLVISYWTAAILLVAAILSSLGYNFAEGTFIGTLFLPGALALKYFFPKAVSEDRHTTIKNTVFLILGIITMEILLCMLAHWCISVIKEESHCFYNWHEQPEILTNPAFLSIIIVALAAGSYVFEQWLDRKYPTAPRPITFFSNRKNISLNIEEILFIESNDSITTVYATDNRQFRNKTPISQWEAILGKWFVRIHRSFLVNKNAISRTDIDTVYIGNTELPISRKYKDAVRNLKPSPVCDK